MVAIADVILKIGSRRSRVFKATTTATSNHVEGCLFFDGFFCLDWPGSFIRVDMAIPDNVNMMFLIQWNQLANAKIAEGPFIGFP